MPDEMPQTKAREQLRKAMRALRDDLKITQVQLANAVGLTPTSIYRYESAETLPDTAVLAMLWHYALNNGSHAAAYFSDMLADAMPPLQGIFDRLSANQETLIDSVRVHLGPDDRIMLMALVSMLTNAPDVMAIRIINILLEPWIEAAKTAFSKQLGDDLVFLGPTAEQFDVVAGRLPKPRPRTDSKPANHAPSSSDERAKEGPRVRRKPKLDK